MTIESEGSDFIFVPEIDLFACPFFEVCQLPKHQFLCKIPECKVICSEYLSKVKNLKPRILY